MSSPRPELRLDWCSHAAAKYAVEKWHYSRSMPAGKTVNVGAWEAGQYIGCVIFARGSNKHIGTPFGLTQTQCVELVRVALSKHQTSTSKVVAIACRLLRRQSHGLRLVISFADMTQGHVGTIYQAGGWLYTGQGTGDPRSRPYIAPNGSVQHWRTVAGVLSKRGMPSTVDAAVSLGFKPQDKLPKHRYLMPLDDAMRAQIAPLARPYPKRAKHPGDASGDQTEEGGSIPTRTLQPAHAS